MFVWLLILGKGLLLLLGEGELNIYIDLAPDVAIKTTTCGIIELR